MRQKWRKPYLDVGILGVLDDYAMDVVVMVYHHHQKLFQIWKNILTL